MWIEIRPQFAEAQNPPVERVSQLCAGDNYRAMRTVNKNKSKNKVQINNYVRVKGHFCRNHCAANVHGEIYKPLSLFFFYYLKGLQAQLLRSVLTCASLSAVCVRVFVCVLVCTQDNIDVEFQHPLRGVARCGNGLVERVEK